MNDIRKMRHGKEGFTLIELMVVLGITGLFVVLAVMGYNRGILLEYAVSQQMRSMVNAIHVAQWRALQNKNSAFIQQGQSTGTLIQPGNWYPEVTFDTVTPHGLLVGDMVIFTNLAQHTSMNVGRYYVASIPTTTQFKIDCYTQVPSTDMDTDPGALSTERPAVLNTRTASTLILMKSSYVKAQGQPLQSQLLADPQNFVYNDTIIRVWDMNATFNASQVDAQTFQIQLAFDARGFPANPAGYQLALGKAPADQVIRKRITVSPTGKIGPGA